MNEKQLKYTDTRLDEQARGMSIKAMPVSLVLEGGTGKSFLINLTDCPGERALRGWGGAHCGAWHDAADGLLGAADEWRWEGVGALVGVEHHIALLMACWCSVFRCSSG